MPFHPPSSQYLTHKYPIWEGCTLGEIALVTLATLLCGLLICLAIGLLNDKLAESLLLMIPIIFIAPKFVLKKLARFKAGKPHGYILVQFRLALDRYTGGLFPTPYIQRLGRWSTQASLRRGGP